MPTIAQGSDEMESKIDWSNAPADATHYQAETHGVFECWLKPGHSVRVSRREQDWREDGYADDLIATSAIKRPWSGEGLPPVGVVCEVDGENVVIVAHHCNGVHAIYAESITDGLLCYGDPGEFRHIRTPEQIAYEERESAVDEMQAIYEGGNYHAGLYALYDAGYRKQ